AGGAVVPRGPMRVALVAIWAFAAWTLLSTVWAQSPALAWEGADRTILYAALVTLALLTLAPARRLAVVGHAVVGGISLLALVSGPLLEPYDAFTAGKGAANPEAIRHAANALSLVTVGAFAIAFLLVLLDNGLRAPQLERGRHLARAGLAGIALVVLVGGLV